MVIRMGHNPIRLWRKTCTEGRPFKDTGRRWPSTSQGERLQKKPMLPTSSPQISSLQNCKTITIYYFSHSVCDTLLRQSEQTNISGNLWFDAKHCEFYFFGAKYYYIPISIIESYSRMHLRYLEKVWFFWVLLGVSRAELSLVPFTEAWCSFLSVLPNVLGIMVLLEETGTILSKPSRNSFPSLR